MSAHAHGCRWSQERLSVVGSGRDVAIRCSSAPMRVFCIAWRRTCFLQRAVLRCKRDALIRGGGGCC
jgi:hypothetical protein